MDRRVTLPRAWIAAGRVSRDRGEAQRGSRPALLIFAVSVRGSFSAATAERLRLMNDVVARFGRQVPSGVPSLWVFPGGYFGYSAAREQWRRLNVRTRDRIERGIRSLARRVPIPTLIAVGVDRGETQQVWVTERSQAAVTVSKITRGVSEPQSRQFRIGSMEAAFFVCGEFTGSHTYQNGPFCSDADGRRCYLSHPLRQLQGCDVLVDLAHYKVSGSISGRCGPRMVHRKQMERFSKRGVAVLTHHHGGALLGDRPHFKHQSNWIVFRHVKWLSESAVTELR